MDDASVIHRIDELVEEEHRLRSHASSGTPLGDEDRQRLQQVEVQLDQCWDLLRRRRARRTTGADPDEADVRDPGTVEHYMQ